MKFSDRQLLALALSMLPLAVLSDGGNCIRLKGDKDYNWKADGDFQGEGVVDDEQHCFGSGSGGISFGHPDAASKGMSGNTRLECHFPENESDADFFNCNLSLVDGFSAAVTCSVEGGGWPNSKDDSAPLGCGYDLLASCPAADYDDGCKCCKNKQGATATSINGVDPVFQKCDRSKENPNSAEVYFNMEGAYKFSPNDFPLTCTVGKGEKPKDKRAVDAHHGSAVEHKHAHRARSSMHTAKVKARGVAEMLSR